MSTATSGEVSGLGWTTWSVAVPTATVTLPFTVAPVTVPPLSVGSFQTIATPAPARSVLQSDLWVVHCQPGSVTGSVPPETVRVREPSAFSTTEPCVADGIGSGASAMAGTAATRATRAQTARAANRVEVITQPCSRSQPVAGCRNSQNGCSAVQAA